MKGNPAVIAGLKAALALEANLQLQYHADARMLRNIGLSGGKASDFSSDSRCFLKKLMKRLLLFGESVAYSAGAVADRASVTELFSGELVLENAIVAPYEEQIRVATGALDDTTRNLYEHLLKWHEEHIEWLERQLRLIASIGEQDFIASKI